ncbi:replication protein A 70 kDa DNA-binding subunit B [Artemisia annua]|uniref:Replication protein A 70 kDa DNA-binding subunit B n=1 Tax=Artemisia annua TaxID=35608 RepID=A0A2U1MPN4_ARTAN|nr:replication protein A 70 kDa DNA-binding subunit B [Artemisia annua]
MATYVSGFINDLSAVKDNIKLRVRIVRSWMQDVYGRPGLKNLELVLMDEQSTKMQATMRMALVNGFKHRVEEGSVVTLSRYSLGEIQPKYQMAYKFRTGPTTPSLRQSKLSVIVVVTITANYTRINMLN